MATAVDVLAQVVAVLDIDVGHDIVHELSLRQGPLGSRIMRSVYGEFLESVSSFRGPSAPGVVLTIEQSDTYDGYSNSNEDKTLLDVAVVIANGGEEFVHQDRDVSVAVPTRVDLVGAMDEKMSGINRDV